MIFPMSLLSSRSSRFLRMLLAFGLGCIAAWADELDDRIRDLMAKRHIPGLSLAIVKDGAIVRAQGYGVTAVEGGIPVTPDTLFQAGSVSKPVSAFGALLLVEQKKISLDDDINRSLRSWQLPDNEFTAGNPVTLRRLLSHSAGTTVHGFPGYAVGKPVPTLQQVLDGEKPANTPAVRVDLVPGSKWRYSGGGYSIVQQAMIDVSGQTFPDYMRKNVLVPAGMLASSFEQPMPADRASVAAAGHRANGRKVPGGWHIYPEMAAAGLWTTPSDLARFVIVLQASLAGEEKALLSRETASLMVTLEKGNFGLGLAISGSGPSARFTHGGRDEGFDANLIAYCEKGLGAVVMINANDNSSAMRRVMSAIAEAYAWPDFPGYAPPKPIEDKEPDVTAQVRQIFLDAQESRFTRDLYFPELGDLVAKAMEAGTARQLKAMGELKSIVLIERRDEGTNRIYRYLITFENETIVAFCRYAADGRLNALNFQPE